MTSIPRIQRLLSAAVWSCLALLPACKPPTPTGSAGPGQPAAEEQRSTDALGRPRVRVVVSAESIADPMTFDRGRRLQSMMKQRSGVDAMFLEAQGHATLQAQQIHSIVEDRSDFLVVFPGDLDAIASELAAAMGKGIKVILIGREAPHSLCTTCVFADEHRIGELAGFQVIEALTRKAQAEGKPQPQGRVVQITGPQPDRVSRERSAGFLKALAAQPGIVLVHDAPGNWDPHFAMDRLAEALRIQRKFDVVFCQDDYMAQAAHQYLRQAIPQEREKMFITGVDGALGPAGGIEMLTQGELEATIYNPSLVDVAWKLILKWIDQPNFQAKDHYQQQPLPINLDKALDILRNGPPAPEI